MSSVSAPVRIDPVNFEIFAHRLWAVGEEGRIALQRVESVALFVAGPIDVIAKVFKPFIVALSIATARMAARGVIVRRLEAVEGDPEEMRQVQGEPARRVAAAGGAE